MTLVLLALSILVVALASVCYYLFVRNGRLLVRIEELEQHPRTAPTPGLEPVLAPGSGAMDFALPDTAGTIHDLWKWRGREVLLTFISPTCPFSHDLLARLGERDRNGPLPVLVSFGSVDENRRLEEEYDLDCPLLLQEATEVAYLYLVSATPSGYLIDETGKILSALTEGVENLVALLDRDAPGDTPGATSILQSTLHGSAHDVLPVGTAAPSFSLPTASGGRLSIEDFLGRETLVVFSDPDCTPCHDLVPALEQTHRSGKGPAIVMVSRGTQQKIRHFIDKFEITFPVGMQAAWEVSQRFGLLATPVAFLIGPRGMIAAPPALGPEGISILAERATEAFVRLPDKEAATVRA